MPLPAPPRISSANISPLNMNKMRGRMLQLPAAKANKKRQILLIYDRRASLERVYSAAQLLSSYGLVTVPDLPGFGGMDSFYKIGRKPTLDNFADYLAAFIKLRYKNRRLTAVGWGFGFLVLTRTLQKYPEIAQRVDLIVSYGGFAHHEDLRLGRRRYFSYRWAASIFGHRLSAAFFRNVVLMPEVLRSFYQRRRGVSDKAALDFEVSLWRQCDIRTYMTTLIEILKLDNCRQQIDVPLWHLSFKGDRYFDKHVVEQHLRVVFSELTSVALKPSPTVLSALARPNELRPLLPEKLRRKLR